MANPYSRCGLCLGNMWPPGEMKTHPHIDRTTLKLKYRRRPMGWSRAASPRTNPPTGKSNPVVPRRRAYGPWG